MTDYRAIKRAINGAVAAILVLGITGAVRAEVHYRTVTVLHTNDIHGHMFPFELDEEDTGGYARHATIIRGQNGAARNVIVASAGDIWNRGPLQSLKGRPDIAAMNAIGYEAWTLGNGEFYAGVANILERQRQAAFPCLSANIRFRDGRDLGRRFVIEDIDGFRVAMFGLTAPRIAAYPTTGDLEVLDPIETAKEVVRELSGRADVIIALTHIGFELDQALAAAVREIDLIVGGDSHTVLERPVLVPKDDTRALALRATPIVQAGDFGRYVGRTTIYLRQEDSSPWLVVSASGELIAVDGNVEEDRCIAAFLAPYQGELRKRVATLKEAIPAHSGDRFPLASLVARFAQDVCKAEVGVYNVNGVQGDLAAGEVTGMDLAYAIPFENRLVAARVSREGLFRMLELEPCVASGLHISYSPGGGVTIGGLQRDHDVLVAATEWHFTAALGALPNGARVIGDMRELFTQWLAENNPTR